MPGVWTDPRSFSQTAIQKDSRNVLVDKVYVWYIYRSMNGWVFRVHVGKYTSPMDPMGIIIPSWEWSHSPYQSAPMSRWFLPSKEGTWLVVEPPIWLFLLSNWEYFPQIGTYLKPPPSNKSTVHCCTTAKMIHELLPNMIKVIKILRARGMIRLLPERYDLNRPLVVVQFIKKSTLPILSTSKKTHVDLKAANIHMLTSPNRYPLQSAPTFAFRKHIVFSSLKATWPNGPRQESLTKTIARSTMAALSLNVTKLSLNQTTGRYYGY